MKYKIYLLILLLLTTSVIASCSGVIKMEKIPELEGGSPLGGIKPVTFTINHFKNAADDEGIVGIPGGALPKYKTDRQVNDIVRQAIINELIRNGHRVLPPEDSSKANVVIDGTVWQYWASFKPHKTILMLSSVNHVIGSVKADITVRFSDSGTILTKSYNGTADLETAKAFTKGNCESALNEALLNMLKDFTMDPDFLDGLNKVGKVSLTIYQENYPWHKTNRHL